MRKKAGMIDPLSTVLAPDLFDNETQKLFPYLRKQILDTLASKIDLDKVAKVFLGGSLTSYHYNDVSDLDIAVHIVDPPEEWLKSGKSELVGDISHNVLEGTGRTYQYYVLP